YEKQKALNAVFGVSFGMEQALWYAPADMTPVENVTFLRSNAFEPIKNECHNVRTNVGLVDISSFAKYEITGPGAESWLDMLLANRLPKVGRLCLTPMLNHNGKLIGDFTVGKLADERFFIFGSGAAEQYHMRWFEENLPDDGSVSLESHGMNLLGLSIAGPRSRELLSRLINEDASDSGLRFLDFQSLDLGMIPTLTGR
ncbi:MAG: aminomethyl transferase family protein, partial [Proteobacteria bacterium]|nr:aminomethyl transferase family protein [Pseudomonadota bacterium]